MKALDTNILVRFLTRDEPDVYTAIHAFLENTRKKEEQLLIVVPVLLETIWVLRSIYRYKREDIIAAIELLFSLDCLIFESAPVIKKWFKLAKTCTQDLPDLLIGLIAKNKGAEYTLTLDKKAAKNSLFRMMR
jgi:predicted nucleic-acid-binding protein